MTVINHTYRVSVSVLSLSTGQREKEMYNAVTCHLVIGDATRPWFITCLAKRGYVAVASIGVFVCLFVGL